MSIRKNIQAEYTGKLCFRLLCLAVLLLFWFFSSFRAFFSPVQALSENGSCQLSDSSRYASFDSITLHYTGYSWEKNGKTKGYYYYGFLGDDCLFFLLKNSTCGDGQDTLTVKNLRGAVLTDKAAQERLISGLAEDLSWDSSHLEEITLPFFLVEQEYHALSGTLAYGLLFLLTLISLASVCLSILYIRQPALAPCCGSFLSPFRSGMRLLKAEKELEDNCLVQGEGFFLTRHFLIELGRTTHIFPLRSLAWVYEHNVPAHFFGHRRKVRYTITYCNKRKHAVHSVYNRHTDVDTILSYLRDYYPEILNGYTPENQELFKKL